jgi:hypothetical protein
MSAMPSVSGSAPSVVRQRGRDAITVSVAYVPFGQALGAPSASTGMTGPEGHQAVSALASAAPDAPQRYAATTEELTQAWEPARDDFDVFLTDGLLLRNPAADLTVALRLDPARVDRNIVALRAQAGRTPALFGALGEERARQWWSSETFVAADTARSRMQEWGTRRVAT